MYLKVHACRIFRVFGCRGFRPQDMGYFPFDLCSEIDEKRAKPKLHLDKIIISATIQSIKYSWLKIIPNSLVSFGHILYVLGDEKPQRNPFCCCRFSTGEGGKKK